jgi:hypothetical protein
MNLGDVFQRIPPAKLKLFAPNGDTREVFGFVGVRTSPKSSQLMELFLQEDDGKVTVLSKKVVVVNQETGIVAYNPRQAPNCMGPIVFFGYSEREWLKQNPHWPGILELYDNPTA